MSDLQAHWHSMAERLQRLIGMLRSEVDESVLDEVRYFADHREFGVAVQGLEDYLRDHGIGLEGEATQLLASLKADMITDA